MYKDTQTEKNQKTTFYTISTRYCEDNRTRWQYQAAVPVVDDLHHRYATQWGDHVQITDVDSDRMHPDQ